MANAMVNTLMGRGHEYTDLYQGCKLKFLGIGNIHVMRESFKRLSELCQSRVADEDDSHWLSALEATSWLENVRAMLRSAIEVAELIDKKGCSILTHCSDGWDRTSQLVSLAQLLLDPFYRTILGFEILISKEWISFGHMFGMRHGHGMQGGGSDEYAPIFLMFLDAVWQVSLQFPASFEFNENLLITIMDAIFSCRFGTFLYNSEKERVDADLSNKTISLWSYINSNSRSFTNPHYLPNSDPSCRVLIPCVYYPRLQLWVGYYLRWNRKLYLTDSTDKRTWMLHDECESLKACIQQLLNHSSNG